MTSQYHVKAASSRAIHSLTDGEVHDFSSVEKFLALNLQAFTAMTSSVNVSYDFLIIRPVELARAEDVSQRFKVSILISEPAEFESGFVVVSPLSFEERLERRTQCATEIEYADIAIARSLQAVLNEWVSRSRLVQKDAISDKSAALFRKASGYSIPASAILMLIGSIFLELRKYNNLITPMRYLLVVAALTIGISIITVVISENINSIIGTLRQDGEYFLTSGDRLSAAEKENERSKSKGRIVLLIGGVLITFIVGLIVNYVSVKLLPNR